LTDDNTGFGGSGVTLISYNIDGGVWNVYSTPFNLSGLDEGLHTIYYNATDYAGNIEITKQIVVYLDINNISSSIDFNYYEGSGIKYINNFTQFIINWNDGTGSGLKNIFYKIDSEPFSVHSAPFTLSGYSEGLHDITYYTIDNVGNVELEKSITIYLDITALDLNIFYNVIYSSNYIDENTSISITSIEDLGSGVKNVQYRIDEGIWINGTEFNLNGLTLGEHAIYYRVEDNVGNFREKLEVVFLVTNESDIDDDGLTYQEEQDFSTDPFNDDTDGDKLLDGDEVNMYYTNPISQDTDGDGYSDYDEIIEYGTDPNNALSSPTMNIIIFIVIFSTMTISGFVGVKKWKVVHRKRIEDEVITLIIEDKNKVLEHNVLNERLQKVKSKLNFEKIGKKRGVNGQYILNGALFVKDTGIEKFETLIKDIVKKIYDQNLSTREDANLIKLNIKDLEQDEKLMEFIKHLNGERV
ncbi:MAG: OmpL47-type beta-barrel domain-containing protein, partial [Promethearchaeota archaeon]